jgi:hypothetical protein
VSAVARHAGPRRYQRREPEATALYAVLQRHLSSVLEHSRADDAGVPRFVDKELRRFVATDSATMAGARCNASLRAVCASGVSRCPQRFEIS